MSITLTHVKGPEAGSPNKQVHQSDISIPLPAVLGRGALLKCAEKKVSRRHATLDWDDDGVIINSVHQSPTFVIVSGKKQKLNEGESSVLGHGDKFGLLEDAFWFRVTLEHSTQSCDKENTLKNNSEAKLVHNNIKELNSLPVNRNEELKQKKQIITNKANKLEESNVEDDKVNNSTSTLAEDEEASKLSIKKNIFHINSSLSSNEKLKASAGTSHAPSKGAIKLNTSPQEASSSIQKISNLNWAANITNQDASTSSHVSANINLPLYTQKILDEAVNDRKRTLPSWMSGSASPTNKATSSKMDSSNAVQHGRKNNKDTPKKQIKSTLKYEIIKNSDNVEEKSEINKISPKKSPKKTLSKYYGMSQNDDEKIPEIKGVLINERNGKFEKNKSPLKRNPKASPSKKTPSKYHGLSQDVSDEGISEGEAIEKKSCTTDLPHNLSDDGSDDNINSPQKNLPYHRKLKTPDKNSINSENEDNGAESAKNNTKNTVGSRLAGVTTTSNTNTSTDDEVRGRKRAAPRGSCQFGSQCYRKNPQHKDEYAHPGDSDYDEDDDEDGDGDDDERPECEFGVDCYRKNPHHRKQFKHTRLPQPQRKAKRKAAAKKGGSDESESDDYDYDDPFLNDDSSDDYAPTDSGEDTNIEDNDTIEDNEDENTQRMLKEGKKFVKNN
ncbi:unnamed protein product [Meganyctiphanes norvegica]|uniref:Aprataxin and PNK-like factor n=1 Tax=Meganyctiphanes norvegica TaxID=48144 RepID=A0AAV2Q066_MEGNR